jgi:hypothetical protein
MYIYINAIDKLFLVIILSSVGSIFLVKLIQGSKLSFLGLLVSRVDKCKLLLT